MIAPPIEIHPRPAAAGFGALPALAHRAAPEAFEKGGPLLPGQFLRAGYGDVPFPQGPMVPFPLFMIEDGRPALLQVEAIPLVIGAGPWRWNRYNRNP